MALLLNEARFAAALDSIAGGLHKIGDAAVRIATLAEEIDERAREEDEDRRAARRHDENPRRRADDVEPEEV